MAEKILNTRIITKNADYSAWETSQLELKRGEIALARLTTILPDGGEQVNYIAKVGNDCAFGDAAWLYAKASDVYAWAKKSSLDVADIPELQLTSTALGKVNEKFTTVDGQIGALNTFKDTTVPGTYETIANVDLVRNRVTTVEGQIAIIQGTEDTAGSLAKVLKDAKEYAKTYTDTAVGDERTRAEGIEANLQAAIDTINNAETGILKVAKDYADTAVAGEKSRAEAAESKLAGDIAKNATAISDEATRAQGVESGLNTRLTTAESDIDSLQAKLADVTTVMDFRGAVSSKPAVDGYQNGDVIVVTDGEDKGKEFVLSDGVWVEFGYTDANTAAISDLQGRMTTAEGKISTLESQVADRYTKAESDAKFETIANADLIRNRVQTIEDDYLKAVDKKAITDRLDAAESDIGTLEGKVASLESIDNATQAELDAYKVEVTNAIAAAVAEAKKYADDNDADTIYDDTELAGRVTTAEGKIATLEAASAKHISVKDDNKMYLGEDVIIFDCGGAE